MLKHLGGLIVGGMIDSYAQASPSRNQSGGATRFLERLFDEMERKPNGPCKSVSPSSKFSVSSHWIYFLWLGVIFERSKIRAPKTLLPVSASFVYLYQSGHHLLNSSLLLTSSLCFARKSQ